MKYNTISERNQLIILFYDEVMLYNSRAHFCHSHCTKTIAHLIFLFSLIFKVIFDILLSQDGNLMKMHFTSIQDLC